MNSRTGEIFRHGKPLLVMLLLCGLSVANAGDGTNDALEQLAERVEELRKAIVAMQELHAEQMDEMKDAYEQRLRNLEQQIAELKGDRPRAAPDDDLDALRREAEEAAGTPEAEARATEEAPAGRQRSLQALNPEISFLGDVSYDWTDNRIQNRFLMRASEISFQAALDPYTRFKGYLAAHQELPELPDPDAPVTPSVGEHEEDISVSLEESYMEWVALPLGSRLRVGQFRQQFGTLNRWHEHSLPSTDVPFALRNVFGAEGLAGLGIGFELPIPHFWADANRVVVEIVNADNDVALAGSSFRDPSVLLRHTGFFDIGDSSYLEVGLNGMVGPNDAVGSDTTLGGVDVNFVWEPAQKARYRGLEVRGEFIGTRFESPSGPTTESTSFYAYVTWKLARRWLVGMRHDNAELPWDRFALHGGQEFREGLRETAWTPFVSFWQSEYVRLRLQYQHAERDFASAFGRDGDDRLWIQATFAAGPHKHEAY